MGRRAFPVPAKLLHQHKHWGGQQHAGPGTHLLCTSCTWFVASVEWWPQDSLDTFGPSKHFWSVATSSQGHLHSWHFIAPTHPPKRCSARVTLFQCLVREAVLPFRSGVRPLLHLTQAPVTQPLRKKRGGSFLFLFLFFCRTNSGHESA